MKFSTVAIFLVAFVNGAFTKPSGILLGYQDALGQYSFGYSAPQQARSEVRSLDGVTRGSYSYVDGAGLVQSTDYTADGQNGFRVTATNLPQAPAPVQETPEVVAARTAHLLAVEEAVRGAKNPAAESDGVTILAKSTEPEPAEEEVGASSKPAEPIVEAVAEAGEPTPEARNVGAAAEETVNPETPQEKGRAIEEPAATSPIASPAASLPVPLVPVNFDLPAVSAYSGLTPGAKADETLPQATPAQGVITPAGTTLKILANPQLVPIASEISSSGEPAAISPAESTEGSARDFAHYERARAVFAPVAPVNVIPLGYDPTISSFLRYSPIPYITYNVW